MIDRRAFFDSVRRSLFAGRLAQSQVEGLTAILDYWEQSRRSTAGDARRWLAYILATAYHETARTMQPIAEWGFGKGRPYGVPDPATGETYYGRGFVQLTWKSNYQAQSQLLGIDLVGEPDLAMTMPVAACIAVEGMCKGDFTGRSLARYFAPGIEDPTGARYTVNGQDAAAKIAGYYRDFLAALPDTPPAARA